MRLYLRCGEMTKGTAKGRQRIAVKGAGISQNNGVRSDETKHNPHSAVRNWC